jgi:hypothetical protein
MACTRSGNGRFLDIYLNDHLAGATAGVALARDLAAAGGSSADGDVLRELAAEIARDRAALQEIMARLEVRGRSYKIAGAWLAEKARRLKLNGTIGTRSPLTSLIELEMLRIGVAGKVAGWDALRAIAAQEPRLNAGQLVELAGRARDQAGKVEDLRVRAAKQALRR